MEETRKPTPTTAPPKRVTMPPNEATKGPIAAPKATKARIALRTPLSKFEILFIKSITLFTMPVKNGKISCVNCNLKPLIALCSSVKRPAKLSSIFSAVFRAVPSAFFKTVCRRLKSSSEASIIEPQAVIARPPKIMPSAVIFVCSSSPRNFSRISTINWLKGLAVRSALYILMPNFSISTATWPGAIDIRVNDVRRLVPACAPLMPAFAIRPSANVKSSIL